ncbi:MAG: gfo/Idh/MocA family oxidoreductase, partial [Calditrichaeota bacterium]
MSKKMSRREFIKRGSVGVAAGSAIMSTNAASYAKILGSNERLNVAIVGIRSRGRGMTEDFAKAKDVHVKTLVDIDENLFASRVKMVEDIGGYRPATEWDMRRAFDDKDIDAVGVANPNHWHALTTI